MKRFSYLILLLGVGCGQPQTATTTPDAMAELRRLHARTLERGTTVDELSDEERFAFVSCRKDRESPQCRWAEENLTEEQWKRIDAAEAENARRSEEMRALLEACASRDEALLRSMYPGRFDFYERVVALAPYDQPRAEAIVVVAHGAPSMRPIRKLLDAGEVDMALRVQVHSGGRQPYPPRRNKLGGPDFHYGWYTPEIERLMEQPRPDCDRLKNSAFRQSACRRDQTLAIVRDWVLAHGHQSDPAVAVSAPHHAARDLLPMAR